MRIDCDDAAVRAVLEANFDAMVVHETGAPADLHYRLALGDGLSEFPMGRAEQRMLHAPGPGALLSVLEADVVVELQKRRPDLLFLHAAALDWNGGACLIAAESGGGKSTTAWALLHHGFGYLSDELSPVELTSLSVLPYPHALCLKQAPPSPYPLPDDAIDLGRTMHAAPDSLPSKIVLEPRPIGAVILLDRQPNVRIPSIAALAPAEAAARLYVNALNPLAHPNEGLDAVVRIAESVRCYAVSPGELSATCAMIMQALGDR